MKHLTALWLVLLICLALGGCDRPASKRAFSSISVNPSAINLGTVTPLAHVQATLTVLNAGTAPLTISAARLSGDPRGAFSVGQTPSSIVGGGQAPITLDYTAPATPGVDQATLEIDSNADNAPTLLVSLLANDAASCSAGLTACAGNCVNTQTDPANCGTCGIACSGGEPCTGGVCGACSETTQCPSGQVCTTGTCGPCTANSQCLAGEACLGGACGPCTANSQCASGQACVNGVCGACTSSSQCAPGEFCVNGACGPCTSSAQCASGQVCVSGACGPCTANGQCAAGQACVSGACGPCSSNGQCASGQACLSGVCGPCSTNGDCGSGQACVSGVCGRCTSSGQCASGQVCISGSCGPCTANGQCPTTEICNAGTCGPCTSNAQCAAGEVCASGICGPCTQDPQCNPGQACFSGTCGPCTTSGCTMQGMIVAWTGTLASIPPGWALADGDGGTPDLRGLFIKGSSTAGATGGSATNAHDGGTVIATLVTGDAGSDVCGVSVGGTSWIELPNDHTHTFASSHSIAPDNNLPPFFEVAYLVKETTSLAPPAGVVVAWTGDPSTIPAGWLALDGISADPDLRGRFLRGAPAGVDPGNVGGASTHDHGGVTGVDNSATSIVGVGNYSFAGNAGNGCATSGEFGHSHTYPHSHTIAPASNEPPYVSATFLSASNASWFPPGTIAMWNGLSSTLPRGWAACDGTNGTPNLTNVYLKGATSTSPPGATGGASTHTHVLSTDPGGNTSVSINTNSPAGGAGGQMVHSHSMPPHTHALSPDSNDPPYDTLIFMIRQ